MTDIATDDKPRINPLTLWIPVILVVGGLVVFWNYLVKLQAEKAKPRLPIVSRIEKNFTFTERSGKQVELMALKGKVIVTCWVFTRCPRGCPGVVGQLLSLHKELGDNPDVHFLSVSVDPDDTPEQLKKFADGLKITGDNWWFVNGPKDPLRSFMGRYFRFDEVRDVPEAERMSPDDKFLHDMKVCLVDKAGHVRGFYDISSADPEYAKFYQEKIRKDIQTLLNESDPAK